MTTEQTTDGYVKIAFPLTGDGEFAVETMWAICLADGFYVIDNSPFSAFGISHKDVVSAKPEGGMLVFQTVMKRGGHSTYRIKLNLGADHAQFLKYWPQLALLGFTYEGASQPRRLYSIDVPKIVVVPQVDAYLEKLEQDGIWEFEEAHYFAEGDEAKASGGTGLP